MSQIWLSYNTSRQKIWELERVPVCIPEEQSEICPFVWGSPQYCYMSPPPQGWDFLMCVWRDSFICVAWLFTRVTCLRGTSHACDSVWHVLFERKLMIQFHCSWRNDVWPRSYVYMRWRTCQLCIPLADLVLAERISALRRIVNASSGSSECKLLSASPVQIELPGRSNKNHQIDC